MEYTICYEGLRLKSNTLSNTKVKWENQYFFKQPQF